MLALKQKMRTVTVGLLVLTAIVAFDMPGTDVPVKVFIPSNFPAPVYDLAGNPVTEKGFELGRKLFYDGIISRDGTISCGSCHQQVSGFTQQDHDLSHGVGDMLGRRNSLPVFNAIFKKTFFWDGGVHNLDLVPMNAIENHVEMDEQIDNVLKKLNASTVYKAQFKQVFGVDTIGSREFLKALSQFMATMVSANSRYDKFVRNEGGKLDNAELEGMALFKQKCATCHATDLFTDGSYRNNGVTNDFRFDKGREEITQDTGDIGKFKVPSLRNVEFTGPYMHDGSIATLEDVLEHYNSGVKESPTLDTVFRQKRGKLGLQLTAVEQKKIILFLKTLTDTAFLNDKRFSQQ